MGTPRPIDISLVSAKYTKLLKDVSTETLNAIETLFSSFDKDDTNNELYNHFISMYRFNEICIDDEALFLTIIEDTFNEHKDYYTQVLEAYKKDINIDDITSKSSNRTDTNNGTQNESGNTSGSNTTRKYDLPNKVINPNEEDGYLTAKDKNESTGTVQDTKTHNNTYTSTNNSKDNRDFIRLKKEYLSHIRSIHEEFADRFSDCFLHIY